MSSREVQTCVDFLRANLARMVESDDFPIAEFAQEVRELRDSIEHLDPDAQRGEGRTRIKCPADHPDADGRLCDNWLHVDPTTPRDDITCRRCGTTWTSDRLVRVALVVPGEPIWMTAGPICAYYSIGAVTLHKWVRDGYVARRGELFNVADVIAVVNHHAG